MHVEYTERNLQENVVVTPLSLSSLPIDPTSVNDTESSWRQISPKHDINIDEKYNGDNNMGRK